MMSIKKHVISLIALILMMICFASALLNGSGNSWKNRIHTFSLKHSFLDGAEAAQMQSEEAALDAPVHFTIWGESKKQKIENKELFRETDADVITVKGDSNLVYPSSYNLQANDLEGCLISTKAANALFGSHNVVGNTIEWNDKVLTIRGTLKSSSKILIVQADEKTEAILDAVAIDLAKRADGNDGVDDFVNRAGFQGEKVNLGVFSSWSKILLVVLPLLMGIEIFVPIGKRIYKEKNTPVKFLIYALLMAAAVILFVKLSEFHFQFPSDMIPSKWSDFEFWTDLYKKKMIELSILLKGEKTHVEMLAIAPFLQVTKYMICSIILYLIFLRKAAIRKCSTLTLYIIVSMAAAFLTVKSFGVSGRVLVYNTALWFTTSFFFFGKWLIDLTEKKEEILHQQEEFEETK